MECFNLEKFIFCIKQLEYSIEIKGIEKISNKKSSLVLTMKSIYLIESDQIKPEDKDIFLLENYIKEKIHHESFFISNYDESKNNSLTIWLRKRDENFTIKLDLKDSQKDTSNFLHIMILLDGYKLICETMDIDVSINMDWLKDVIENYLINTFILIDDNFFTVDEEFLIKIVNYLAKFDKYVIKSKLNCKKSINFFNSVFVDSNDESEFKTLFLIKSLKLINNELNDFNFIKLIPLFCSTNNLTFIEISKNFISGKSLSDLSHYFKLHMKNLEKMNFSYNWIDSFGTEEFLENTLELKKINYIDLSNNYLDNDFLKILDIYLRKNIQNIPEVTFDLSKNMFDSYLRYPISKFDDEEDNKLVESMNNKIESVYALQNFVDNLSKMKLKIKIIIDLVKHFKIIDSEIVKKVTEHVKQYRIKIKTTPIGDEIVKLSQYRELSNLITEVDQENTIKKTFNLNKNIDDFYSLFIKIKSGNGGISFFHFQNFIKRLKLFSYHAIFEKNYYNLEFLNVITDYFKISYMMKVQSEYIKLKTKSKIIHQALSAIINFEGNSSKINKNFFHEINNFLDIFLKEAYDINLTNEFINFASYIQFIRNNKLRYKLFKLFAKTITEEKVLSHKEFISELDPIYDKYIDLIDYNILKVPSEIIVKTLSLHMNNVDYLDVTTAKKSELVKDFALGLLKLKEEESFVLRNIYDRISFLFTSTSDKKLDPINQYYLHKNNDNMKITRLIFRYLNNMDIKFLFDESTFFDYEYIKKEKQNLNESKDPSDKNAMLEYNKIRNDPNIEDPLQSRKNTLTFQNEIIKQSLINSDIIKNMTKEFNEIALKINYKFFNMFDKEFDEQSPNSCKNSIRFFIYYYLKLKKNYKENEAFLDLINQEIIFQIYRHLNRNDFKDKTIQIKTIFGFFCSLSLYLDLSPKISSHFIKWLNSLIQSNYYSEYCKEILFNLTENREKPSWVISSIEIEAKIEMSPLILPIVISEKENLFENITICNSTTVSDIYNIIINSKYMNGVDEKNFYWLYFNYNKDEEYLPLYSEEYIVEIFSMYEDILEKRISEKVYNFKQLINISLKRRIFSPIILIGDLKNLCERELQIIYEQMEINFIYKLFSHLISDQDLTLLSCIIYEFIIRYNPEKKKEIESNSDFPRKFLTENNIIPKVKQNFFNNNYDKFISKFREVLIEQNIADQTDSNLKLLFLNTLRNYEIFFSSNYFLGKLNFGNVLLENILISININGISLIEDSTFNLITKFRFDQLIYIFFNSPGHFNLFFSFEFLKNEKRCKLLTNEARIITEEILSYSQLKLFDSKSQHIELKKFDKLSNQFYILKEYRFIFQNRIPNIKDVSNSNEVKIKSSSAKLLGKQNSARVEDLINKLSLINSRENSKLFIKSDLSEKKEQNILKNEESIDEKSKHSVIFIDNEEINDEKSRKMVSPDKIPERKIGMNIPDRIIGMKVENNQVKNKSNNLDEKDNKEINKKEENPIKSTIDRKKDAKILEENKEIPIKKNNLSFEHLNKKKDSKTSLSVISNNNSNSSGNLNNSNVKALNNSVIPNEKPKINMPQLNPSLFKNSSNSKLAAAIDGDLKVHEKPEKIIPEGGKVDKKDIQEDKGYDESKNILESKLNSSLLKRRKPSSLKSFNDQNQSNSSVNSKLNDSILIPQKEDNKSIARPNDSNKKVEENKRSISEDPNQTNSEKTDKSKRDRAKSKISSAISNIPNQELTKKSVNSKGIDPTTNIEI